MANQFVTLPVPSPAPNTSEAGAAVDTSTLAAKKTICVTIPSRYIGNLEIQFANDVGGTVWNSIQSFPNSAQTTIEVVARFMRVLIANYRDGVTPTVTLSAETDHPIFINVPSPSGGGTGTPIDCSTLPSLKTVSTGGLYTGDVDLEMSNDGVNYHSLRSFRDSQTENFIFTAQWLRATHMPSSLEYPGTALIDIGCANAGSGGGGSGTATNVAAFIYTATGAEGTSFIVNLPATRTSAYVVTATHQGGVSDRVTVIDIPVDDHTNTNFRVVLTASLTAGDKIGFHIIDATSVGV